jgi:hypothetical protein
MIGKIEILTEAEFLDGIQTKVLRVFLLAIRSHPYSFALKFLFLQTHATLYEFFKLMQPLTVSTVQLLYIVKEKGGTPDRIPYPLPWLKKSIQIQV